jgi:hypothetical protein
MSRQLFIYCMRPQIRIRTYQNRHGLDASSNCEEPKLAWLDSIREMIYFNLNQNPVGCLR